LTRGPAKGYVEALEIRLKETERVLWQLITSSTKQELSTAFAEETVSQIPKSLAISTLATTEEKRSAIAYWEQFPLQNLEDVQPWIESLEPISNPEDLPLQTSSPGEELAQIPRVIEDLQLENFETSAAVQPDIRRGYCDPVAGPMSHSNTPVDQPAFPSFNTRLQVPEFDPSLTQHSAEGPRLSDRGTSPSRFGFSKEFQDMFLW
jgi:hypothetical protein